MSKQQTKASINLGHETHARGFNDGLNGRPKTIKKSHAHAHRYHIGYRLGDHERKTTMQAALAHDHNCIATRNYIRNPAGVIITSGMPEDKPEGKGLLSRIWGWIRN